MEGCERKPSAEVTVHGFDVLIAVDSAPRGIAIADYLELHGCRVSLAYHGERVLQKALREGIDAVVLDVDLPPNGYELVRRIRRGRATLPIVGLALTITADIEATALEAGFDAIFYLHADVTEIWQAIARLRSRSESP